MGCVRPHCDARHMAFSSHPLKLPAMENELRSYLQKPMSHGVIKNLTPNKWTRSHGMCSSTNCTNIVMCEHTAFSSHPLKLPAMENELRSYLQKPMSHGIIKNLIPNEWTRSQGMCSSTNCTNIVMHEHTAFSSRPLKLPAMENELRSYLQKPMSHGIIKNLIPNEWTRSHGMCSSTNCTNIVMHEHTAFSSRPLKLPAMENELRSYLQKPMSNGVIKNLIPNKWTRSHGMCSSTNCTNIVIPEHMAFSSRPQKLPAMEDELRSYLQKPMSHGIIKNLIPNEWTRFHWMCSSTL